VSLEEGMIYPTWIIKTMKGNIVRKGARAKDQGLIPRSWLWKHKRESHENGEIIIAKHRR
jgi:hypothetical protein